MKTKLKIMMALLVAICITGISTVNAATEFSDKDKNMTVTLDKDLGIEGTVETFFGLNVYGDPCFHVYITDVDQTLLNEFASKERIYNAEIKVKVSSDLSINDIGKVFEKKLDSNLGKYVETEVSDAQIKEIDGQKYLVYNRQLEYTNRDGTEGFDNKNDVRQIVIVGSGIARFARIEFTKKDGSKLEYNVLAEFHMSSEYQCPSFGWAIEDEYGKYLSPEFSDAILLYRDKYYQFYGAKKPNWYSIPATANLKEYFYNFCTEVYQGESIEVENVGTLKYAGIERGRYVYKNSLDNLRATDADDEMAIVKIKSESGYEFPIRLSTWHLSESEMKSEHEYTQITDTVWIDSYGTVSVSGKSDSEAEIKAGEIPETDTLYKRLLDGLTKNIDIDKYDYSNIAAFDLHEYHWTDWMQTADRDYSDYGLLGGYGFEGDIELTFDVGAEYNGKKYVIGHLKHGLEYEYFEGTVKDEKITITVESLSPFMISFISEKGVTVEEEELKNDISVTISGKGTFTIEATEIEKINELYKSLLDGLEKAIDKSKYDSSELIAYDIHTSSGSFEGSLELTFNVGAEHNGKKYVIGHLKHGLEYEYFEGTVKDGKITITVDSLSPFMVSLITEKASVNPTKPENNNKPNKGELDDTPKTGSETEVLNAVSLSSITTMITLAGVVVCKKRK